MYEKYSHVQRNGQRIYGGPPPNWSGSYPAKGSEIFVGKLPHDIFEDELVPIFEAVRYIELNHCVIHLIKVFSVSPLNFKIYNL